MATALLSACIFILVVSIVSAIFIIRDVLQTRHQHHVQWACAMSAKAEQRLAKYTNDRL